MTRFVIAGVMIWAVSLGSRHNVRHWGCSCKEPRIAMAGHHRFLYYLTGDYRIGEVMNEVKDADKIIKGQKWFQSVQEDGSCLVGARSGPDWSSFVSNWMTFYERMLDNCCREKIETGTKDIAATPFGFAAMRKQDKQLAKQAWSISVKN